MIDLHCAPKNVTTLSRFVSDVHESILIIFGTYVTEKVDNHKVFYSLTSLTNVLPLFMKLSVVSE